MSNVRRGKVDLNNVSVLNSGLSKPRALLVSRKTVDSLEATVEKAQEPVGAETLYANPEQPLFNRGYLEETRPIQRAQQTVPEEAPLVAGPSSNPINRMASRVVGFDVTGPTPVEQPQVATPTIAPVVAPEVIETPRIVPVSSTTPQVMEIVQ